MTPNNFVFIYKNDYVIAVEKEDVQEYLALGWKLVIFPPAPAKPDPEPERNDQD